MNDTRDNHIDQLAEAIRRDGEAMNEHDIEAATERVWQRLAAQAPAAGGQVLRCADIQALLPAYQAAELSPERELLVADHTRECLGCRRALKRATEPQLVTAPVPASRRRVALWALAAALVAGLGVTQWVGLRGLLGFGGDLTLTVVDGDLMPLAEAAMLAVGTEVPYGTPLRTTHLAGAVVRLADGSRVEVRERSAFSVRRGLSGTTIDLARGDVIVEAAKQRDGKLFVATGDCLVSVTGTVFSVNSGARGSRVSVFEGEVRVDHGGVETVLEPGNQLTTQPNLSSRPLADEISWSRDAERHLALLAELVDLDKQLAALPRPGLRTSSELIALLPAESLFVAALPNLSNSLGERMQLLEERLANNPALTEWWGEHGSGTHGLGVLSDLLDRISGLGDGLGDEVVLAGWPGTDAGEEAGLLIASVLSEGEVIAELDALAAEVSDLRVRRVSSPEEAVADGEESLWVLVGNGLLVASPMPSALAIPAQVARNEIPGLTGTELGARLNEAYAAGVDTVVGLDVGRAIATADGDDDLAILDALGITDVRTLVVQHRVHGDRREGEALLSFAGPRRGITSWLADPGPIGALDFVSPAASWVAAFAVQDPEVMLTELFAAVSAGDSDFAQQLEQFVAEHGFDPVADLAGPLGGELLIAVDGPLAPSPSWKLVVEVYDPLRLVFGIQQLVADLDRQAQEHGGQVTVSEEAAGSRIDYRVAVESSEANFEAWVTFADGYLVAAPSQELLSQALRFRNSGFNLASAGSFQESLPTGSEVDVSAVMYSNFGGLFGEIAKHLPAEWTDEQRQALEALAADRGPTVIVAYAETDAIRVAGSSSYSPLTSIGLGLLGGGGLEGLFAGWQQGGFPIH